MKIKDNIFVFIMSVFYAQTAQRMTHHFYFRKLHDQTEVNWTGYICDFFKGIPLIFSELNSVEPTESVEFIEQPSFPGRSIL